MLIALAALVLASIADVLTTRAGLRSGMLRERNPLMRWATRRTVRMLSVKAAGISLASAAILYSGQQVDTFALGILWFSAFCTTFIAWQNYRLLRAVQRG